MLKEVCSAIYHNKNLLMPVTVGVYILALFGTLSGLAMIFGFILTAFLIFSVIKRLFPIKMILVWGLIFYFPDGNAEVKNLLDNSI